MILIPGIWKILDKILFSLNTEAKALILNKKLVHIGRINKIKIKYLFLSFDLYSKYATRYPKKIQIAVVITANFIEFQKAITVDFSVKIEKFVTVQDIPWNEIPSVSININTNITTIGSSAKIYSQNKYGLDNLSR